MTRLWPRGAPIEVEIAQDGRPARFFWRDGWHVIDRVADDVRLRSTWWQRDAMADRAYYLVTTADGLFCWLYFDLSAEQWRLARLYD